MGLGSGQSFALGGLLQNTTEQDVSKVPWLGDVPILGQLFRSPTSSSITRPSWCIIVTPYLVRRLVGGPGRADRAAYPAARCATGDQQPEEISPGRTRNPRVGPVFRLGNPGPDRPCRVPVGLREAGYSETPSLLFAAAMMLALAACVPPETDYTSSEAVNELALSDASHRPTGKATFHYPGGDRLAAGEVQQLARLVAGRAMSCRATASRYPRRGFPPSPGIRSSGSPMRCSVKWHDRRHGARGRGASATAPSSRWAVISSPYRPARIGVDWRRPISLTLRTAISGAPR